MIRRACSALAIFAASLVLACVGGRPHGYYADPVSTNPCGRQNANANGFICHRCRGGGATTVRYLGQGLTGPRRQTPTLDAESKAVGTLQAGGYAAMDRGTGHKNAGPGGSRGLCGRGATPIEGGRSCSLVRPVTATEMSITPWFRFPAFLILLIWKTSIGALGYQYCQDSPKPAPLPDRNTPPPEKSRISRIFPTFPAWTSPPGNPSRSRPGPAF